MYSKVYININIRPKYNYTKLNKKYQSRLYRENKCYKKTNAKVTK